MSEKISCVCLQTLRRPERNLRRGARAGALPATRNAAHAHRAREIATLRRLPLWRNSGPAGGVLGRRGGHRVDDDGGLLAPELIDAGCEQLGIEAAGAAPAATVPALRCKPPSPSRFPVLLVRVKRWFVLP